MTHDELKQAAMAYLVKAFNEDTGLAPHVVQAAVTIILTPEPK